MATVGVIQARLSSSRFPRKALADLEGHPLIWWVCARVRQVEGLDRVVLAVPPCDHAAFAALRLPCDLAAPEVPEADVLGRFAAVASDLPDEAWVMRITGDCPLWNPAVGHALLRYRDSTLRTHEVTPQWYTADTNVSGFADGEDAELFPAWMLRHADRQATWPADREHVTRYLRRYFPACVIASPEDRGHLHLSVDSPSDLTAVREYLHAESGAHSG